MSKSIAKRHQIIIEKLNEHGYVNVHELSEELNVSMVTIRKDLKILEGRRLLFRTHGSATLGDPYIIDRNIHEKEKIRIDQKVLIARSAAQLVKPNDTIILASGSTIVEFAKQLQTLKSIIAVSASLNASQILNINPDIEVHQLGGIIRKSSNSAIGPYTERMISEYSCSILFMGVDGIDPEYGLTTTNAMEASLNQLMIKSAQKVVVLADSSKFGKRGLSKICEITEVDVLITDSEVSPSIIKRIREMGVDVSVV